MCCPGNFPEAYQKVCPVGQNFNQCLLYCWDDVLCLSEGDWGMDYAAWPIRGSFEARLCALDVPGGTSWTAACWACIQFVTSWVKSQTGSSTVYILPVPPLCFAKCFASIILCFCTTSSSGVIRPKPQGVGSYRSGHRGAIVALDFVTQWDLKPLVYESLWSPTDLYFPAIYHNKWWNDQMWCCMFFEFVFTAKKHANSAFFFFFFTYLPYGVPLKSHIASKQLYNSKRMEKNEKWVRCRDAWLWKGHHT